MKKILFGAFAALYALMSATSCSDTTKEIGSSLIQEESEVVIHNEFKVTGHTTPNQRIESRTIVQLLGDISAQGYGNFTSDFVCPVLPAAKLVTEGVTADDIDSMKLILAYPNGGYVGDSIAPMGLEVFLLDKQLPSPIFSTLDPEEYCDTKKASLASKIYVGNAQGENDSIRGLSYREIKIDLPLRLARDLFNLYVENPSAYAFPANFAKYFPGIYVRNSFGSGRVTQIQRTNIIMYYHTVGTDSEGKEVINRFEGNYFAVTPEVISNNNINFTIDPSLQAEISKDYRIEPPASLLLVLSAKKEEFFLNNSLNDDKTSFLANYNSATKSYSFTGLRNYFLNMFDQYNASGRIKPEDVTFTLTPVAVTTENTSSGYTSSVYVSAITPYIGKPAMVRLDLDKADITFQFSKQSLK